MHRAHPSDDRHRRPSLAAPTLLLLLLAPPLHPAAASEADAPDAGRLLAEYKAAAGGEAWDRVAVLRTTGKLRTSGLAGTFEALEEMTSGRYVTRYDLGVARGGEGFDGESAWQQDGSGTVTVTDSRGDLESASNQAFFTARGFWYPERWPAEIRYDRREVEGERSFHVVEVHPRGGRPAELWLDASTGLLDRIVEEGALETTTTFLSDYRRVEGLSLPFSVRSTTGSEAHDTHLEVTSVEVEGETRTATFEMPASEVSDFELLGGGSSVEIPFELHNNHIYVMASVHGAPERPFLVDTGGLNLLTEAAAAELGIAAQGAAQVHGAGEETADVGFARVESITVGGVRLVDQMFVVVGFDDILAAEGLEFSGLVGFELFRRFVVEIDYAGRRLVLTRPEAFTYQGDGVRVPFRFDNRTPVVEGAIDGLPGVFTLDTGSRSGLAIHGPFADEHDLEARYAPRYETLVGWGVGGGVRGQPIRPVTLTLGSLEIPGVAAEITRQSGGAFTDRYTAGNVGGAVLERFTVIFDYGAQVVIFEPNERFGSPDGPDRSGMWINRSAEGFRVEDVVPGGPAEAADLEVGDLILAVDGRPFGEVSLAALRERFRREPAGVRIELEVAAEGEPRRTELVLRDLF